MSFDIKKYIKSKKGNWHHNNRKPMAEFLKHRCQKCKKQFNLNRLEIHHYSYNYKGDVYGFDWEELYKNKIITLLCRSCHLEWHQKNKIKGNTELKGKQELFCFNCNYQAMSFVGDKCQKCKNGKMQAISYEDFKMNFHFTRPIIHCKVCGKSEWKVEYDMNMTFHKEHGVCDECIDGYLNQEDINSGKFKTK